MQSLSGGMPCAVARAITRNCKPTRNIHGPINHIHEGSFSVRRHASSKAPNLGKKLASKPLPYQPRPSEAHLKPRTRQQQKQQQQRGRSDKAPISDLVRERWFAILGFGSALACMGYFTASLAIYWRSEPAPCYPLGCEPEVPTGRPSIQSPYEFDLHLDKSEWRYGITRLRREISAQARGHVLEVAVGTGRNLEFYQWDKVAESLVAPEEREKAKSKASSWIPSWASGNDEKDSKASREDEGGILSFTGVDISPGMLDIALQRMRQVIPHMTGEIPKKPSFAILATRNSGNENRKCHTVSFLSDQIRLLQSDVQSALPAPPALSSLSLPATSSPAPQKYDTILQTFGLCSVQDPVSLLSLMASSLQPNTGRILLLEHGRSIWDLVNGLLDRGARAHHERFGCWWNRDIEAIVNEAARRIPGLEILRLERPGWATAGTHVIVELRMRDTREMGEKEMKEQKATGWASLFSSLLSTKAADSSEKRE